MKSRFSAVSLLGLALTLSACGGNSPADPATPTAPDPSTFNLSTLAPGQQKEIRAKLKINVVMVGYRPTVPGQVAGPRDVNVSDFTSILPATGRNIARIPSAYGKLEPTGNAFDYDYNIMYANKGFEDGFFSFLAAKGTGTDAALTRYQKAYNCQALPKDDDAPTCKTPATNIALPVTGNLEVDGVKAENWLADHANDTGVDSSQYTIFLVNWYGRSDFKFHSYTRAEADDSDMTADEIVFGGKASRRLNAWGGTPREGSKTQRVWFYDLSANPEAWTNNWDISNADVDGDQVPDYRMPPVWEYGTRKATYRLFTKVGPDLARVARYVAVDLLFTPSPIYRAELTPPDMPENVNLNVAFKQGVGAPAPSAIFNATLSQDRLKVLQPFATISNSLREAPLSGQEFDAYKCLFPLPNPDPKLPPVLCSPDRADATGDRLFNIGLTELQGQYKDKAAYQVPVFAFNDNQNTQPGLLGVAIDDGVTGTQALVYSFLTPELNKDFGYGFTDTITHEVGHHFSLSHPHDGYDAEENTDFGPSGDFAFVNAGDMSNTVMSYNDLTRGFGQFNLDSQYRYLTAAYLNNTNAVLELVQQAGKDKVQAVNAAAKSADNQFASAIGKYQNLDYLGAADQAHTAYRAVVDAARSAGVDVQPYKWYERLEGLSLGKEQPRRVNNYLPVKGTAIRPESTEYLMKLRMAP
jgi:hypothetical protein